MRKLVLLALVLSFALSAAADEKSKSMLQRVAQYVESMGSYYAEF